MKKVLKLKPEKLLPLDTLKNQILTEFGIIST